MIKLGYDRLFFIQIRHDYFEGPCTDISIVPTIACEKNLTNHALIFKQLPDGCAILFSKNEKDEIKQKISSLTSFRFVLNVRNSTVENFTNLPYPSAKLGKRIFYFSNLTNAGIIDSTTTLAKSTGNELGDKDYGWLVNTELTLPLGGNFTQVNLSQLIPGTGKKLIKFFPATGLQNLHIDLTKIDTLPDSPFSLKTGNYILDFTGASQKTEQIYIDNSAETTNAWGVIDIVKDSTIDYTVTTNYSLTGKANPWSYYLIDPANKVTITNNTLANLSTATTGLSGLAFSWIQEADIAPDTYEQRQYALLKQRNAGKRIFLLRSNRGMPKSAESTVSVKLTLDGIQRTLPNPIGSQFKSDSIQTL
ncbi:hypothetical protein CWM47_25440 [Spirosoma pollinicola]|uniref:Uncharacterized protein n=1 Tax=Spirosoma pollinicola TaxID=2057025 RepID=A0A2K8Z4T8_9BACT|nr:hypothetical protein CWM47_25440 [Spirosoma pollinicola]